MFYYPKSNKLQAILPLQKGKERYKTVGFKELAYFHGACDTSFRKVTALLNRIKYQEDNGTPYRTLNSGIEQEARAVNAEIEEKTSSILQEHNFSEVAYPKDESKYKSDFHTMDKKVLHYKLEELKNEMTDKDLANLINVGNADFEDSQLSTNISIDDVHVKKQVLKRENRKNQKLETEIKNQRKEDKTETSKLKKKRKYVYNTIVHIQNTKGQYTLTGLGISSVISTIVAFLLFNGLVTNNWIFFVDGQRTIYSTILKRLAWKKNLTFILDWYHLKKKCEMQLSLGLNNTKKRNEILGKLLYYSWYGLTEKVYDFIDKIPDEYIKNQDALDKLKGYYKRNYNYIPNYALRKKVGLRNSSNRGEKENDLIISNRQKHNGMSWSKKGSNSLGVLTAIKQNKETNNWLNKKEIEFRIAA